MQFSFDAVRFLRPSEALEALASGAVLIDVREDEELDRCAYAVPEIVHLPYGNLRQSHGDLPIDRTLLFACKSGRRSLRAAAYLAFKGHPSVANLEGGIDAWQAEGLPVEGPGCNVID